MKITFIAFTALLFFYGCEKDYDDVIQPAVYSYQVLGLSTFQQEFPGDSTENISITFNSSDNIKSVTYNLYSPDFKKLNSSPILFNKINQNIFSSVITVSRLNPTGNYTLKYYVTDVSDRVNEVAVQTFRYDNGSGNTPPFISNALVDPDTVAVVDSAFMLVTLEAFDEQGLSDIELVYFTVYRPDGSTSGSQNVLNDEGNLGDSVAGDGIYSLIIKVNQNNAKGTYRFEFRARDRNKAASNIIFYNVLIQ